MPVGGLAAGLLVESAGARGALLAMGGVYLLATLSPLVFPAWRTMDGAGAGDGTGTGDAAAEAAVPSTAVQVSSSGRYVRAPAPGARTPRSSGS